MSGLIGALVGLVIGGVLVLTFDNLVEGSTLFCDDVEKVLRKHYDPYIQEK